MIMADKIIELRKKNGWSQEELAEKLEVSRQSVSKWESAQSVPDMNRILMLSKVFGVSTDFLLKDELEFETKNDAALPVDAGAPLRRVSLDEAQSYLRFREKAARRVSLGVLMCILSPILLILLGAGQESGKLALTELQAAGLGLVPLLLLVGGAVALFIVSALQGKPFEDLGREPFETEYGVTGFVRERRDQENGSFVAQLVGGIVLCVISAIPIFAAMILLGDTQTADSDFYYAVAVCALLGLVAAGVWLIVRASIRRGAYTVLLEEGEYSRSSKRDMKKNQALSTVYWSLITAGYLAYSFVTMDWQRSWIVWPVAGVLFGVILTVAGALRNKKES